MRAAPERLRKRGPTCNRACPRENGGMPTGAAAAGERPGSGDGELCSDQSPANRCRGGASVTDSKGHWHIENRVHWVRDVTFDEDRSQIRAAAAPQVMAAFRNLTTTLIRRAGHSNVAAALRRHAAHLAEAFAPLGITYTTGE